MLSFSFTNSSLGTGRNGVFDVRTSESVQLTRIIGPSSPTPKFDPVGEIPTGNFILFYFIIYLF